MAIRMERIKTGLQVALTERRLEAAVVLGGALRPAPALQRTASQLSANVVPVWDAEAELEAIDFSAPPSELEAASLLLSTSYGAEHILAQLQNDPHPWNTAFQALNDVRCTSNEASLMRAQRLKEITDSFVSVALKLGTAILRQRRLPLHLRSIPEASVGGIAGGVKVHWTSLRVRCFESYLTAIVFALSSIRVRAYFSSSPRISRAYTAAILQAPRQRGTSFAQLMP